MGNIFKSALLCTLLALSQFLLAGPQLSCDGVLRGVKRIEIASQSGQIKSALIKLGVKSKDVPEFFNKQNVMFEFPTEGGDPVYGFVTYQKGYLTSQLFSIKNTNPKAAIAAFAKFRTDSMHLADRLGAHSIEIQGGSVINERIAEFLVSQGFEIKNVEMPKYFGEGQQEVFYKVFKIREE